MIPKKFWFVWCGPPYPKWVGDNLERWKELNPEFEFHIVGEDVLLPEWAHIYSRCEDLCTKSDLLRLSVLRRHAGWYFDVDFVPLRPMSELYKAYNMDCGCFLTKQWEPGNKRIANGVIGISTDSPVWEEIDRIIEEAMLKPLERTTFGPLLTTQVVQRCPEVTIGAIKDFYLWRFDSVDKSGKNSAMYYYESLLAENFSSAAIEATCGEHRPFMVHLWCGGKYGWTPHVIKPALTAVPPVRPPDGGFCRACEGRGCDKCGHSGFAPSGEPKGPQLPPREEFEAFLDAWGWKLTAFEVTKIMALPK